MKRGFPTKRQKSEAEFRAEVNRSMKAMDMGLKVTEEQLLKMHNRLRTETRAKDLTDFELEQAFIAWPYVKPVLRMPQNDREYRKLVKVLDRLTDEICEDQKNPLVSMMEILGLLIEKYEDEHVKELP
jgi:HTH-type transcriptional regulator/antitoxin HigA